MIISKKMSAAPYPTINIQVIKLSKRCHPHRPLIYARQQIIKIYSTSKKFEISYGTTSLFPKIKI